MPAINHPLPVGTILRSCNASSDRGVMSWDESNTEIERTAPPGALCVITSEHRGIYQVEFPIYEVWNALAPEDFSRTPSRYEVIKLGDGTMPDEYKSYYANPQRNDDASRAIAAAHKMLVRGDSANELLYEGLSPEDRHLVDRVYSVSAKVGKDKDWTGFTEMEDFGLGGQHSYATFSFTKAHLKKILALAIVARQHEAMEICMMWGSTLSDPSIRLELERMEISCFGKLKDINMQLRSVIGESEDLFACKAMTFEALLDALERTTSEGSHEFWFGQDHSDTPANLIADAKSAFADASTDTDSFRTRFGSVGAL